MAALELFGVIADPRVVLACLGRLRVLFNRLITHNDAPPRAFFTIGTGLAFRAREADPCSWLAFQLRLPTRCNRPSSPGCRLSTTSTLVTKCGLKHWPAVCGLRRGALAIKNCWSQSAGTRTGTKRKTLEEPPSSRAANEREGEWPEPPDTGNGRGRLTPALRIISGRLDLHGNGRISLDHEPVPSGPRRQVSQIAHSPHRRELHTVVQCDWDAVRNAAKVI